VAADERVQAVRELARQEGLVLQETEHDTFIARFRLLRDVTGWMTLDDIERYLSYR
jgi:hypothetical protein